jgi:hypothetical protein
VLRETTSRGLCGLVCPSRTSERGGEGDCVKEGGGEEGKCERERALEALIEKKRTKPRVPEINILNPFVIITQILHLHSNRHRGICAFISLIACYRDEPENPSEENLNATRGNLDSVVHVLSVDARAEHSEDARGEDCVGSCRSPETREEPRN